MKFLEVKIPETIYSISPSKLNKFYERVSFEIKKMIQYNLWQKKQHSSYEKITLLSMQEQNQDLSLMLLYTWIAWFSWAYRFVDFV